MAWSTCTALSTGKTAAEQTLAELVPNAEPVRAGIASSDENEGRRSLADHLANDRRVLTAKGNCAEHSEKTLRANQDYLDGCRFAFFRDIDADAVVAEFLLSLRRDSPDQKARVARSHLRGLSGSTPQKAAALSS